MKNAPAISNSLNLSENVFPRPTFSSISFDVERNVGPKFIGLNAVLKFAKMLVNKIKNGKRKVLEEKLKKALEERRKRHEDVSVKLEV